MRLKFGPLLSLVFLCSCGGQSEDTPPTLIIDGDSRVPRDASLNVPFLHHLLRIESDADRIEVSGANAKPRDVESEGGVGVDVPLAVGHNELQVKLERGDTSQVVTLEVERKPFENITYVKAEEARPLGFFGHYLAASDSKFCTTETREEGYEVAVYARTGAEWALQQRFPLADTDDFPQCTLKEDWLTLVQPGLHVRQFDAEQGDWPAKKDVELAPKFTSTFLGRDMAWGKSYLFVSRIYDRKVDAYRIGEWSAPEATFDAPLGPEGADVSAPTLSTRGDLLLMASVNSDVGDLSLRIAQKKNGKWSEQEGSVEIFGVYLYASTVALASSTQVFVAFGDDGASGVAQLDFDDGAWRGKKVIRERGDGESLQSVGPIHIAGDLLFFSALDDLGGEGINPPYEGDAYYSGALFAFERIDDGFRQAAYLKAPYHLPSANAEEGHAIGEMFGWNYALGRDFLAVTALNDSSSGHGVGANPEDEDSLTSGAVWIFE